MTRGFGMLDRVHLPVPRRGEPIPPGSVHISFSLFSDPVSVRSTLGRIARSLRKMGVPADVRGVAEIVLAEVLNNVVEHAYDNDPLGAIELDIERHSTGLSCRVRDTGRPFPSEAIPHSSGNTIDCRQQNLPEGGYGWQIIKALTEHRLYTRAGQQNELLFLVPIPARYNHMFR